jgi:hypothetical protein
LDSRNQESEKNPLVTFFTIGFQKPGICVGDTGNPRISIYDQRKIPLHHFLPLDSRNQESEQRKIPLKHFLPLDSRNQESTHFLPLESRNQESSQIPGFWIPMVKNGVTGFFSDHFKILLGITSIVSES